MKKLLFVLPVFLITSFLNAQTGNNPFSKFGYDVLVGTSSKGEFEEFHDKKDIVEIGSILYDTKTKKIIKVLDKDSTTINISAATAAMSIDPMCEKYYWISPYAYVANNPIKYIDPDGRVIVIHYGGKTPFYFNGSNASQAPNNTFVQKAIQSYNYNIANGGGESMKALATSKTSGVHLKQYSDNKHVAGTVFWNPEQASKTAEGYTRSPATNLEHEMDHGLSYVTNKEAHKERAETPDKQYGTAEEKRVITGSEAKTAQGNKEYPQGYTRKDHDSHGHIKVNDPTKTTPTQQTQQQNNPSLLERLKKLLE